jgi:hypothetical protein
MFKLFKSTINKRKTITGFHLTFSNYIEKLYGLIFNLSRWNVSKTVFENARNQPLEYENVLSIYRFVNFPVFDLPVQH